MLSSKQLVAKFSDLKTLPHVAIRVTQLVNSDSSSMQEFEDIIKLDPVLVMRMLKLVNSPFFGLINKVEAVSKAVVYIGMQNLRNLVAIEALRDLFKDEKGVGFSRKQLWHHSATVAILSQMIAKRIFGLVGEDEFLAGIIHDVGLIVEDQLVGTELRRACLMYTEGDKIITEYETETLGTHHGKVGGLLAREWNMQDEVLLAIKQHHNHEKEYPIPSIVAIVQIAEYIANRMKYSAVQNKADPLPSYLKSHMKERIMDYKVLIKDLPAEMAKADELYGSAEI